jgi:hypothetical protein
MPVGTPSLKKIAGEIPARSPQAGSRYGTVSIIPCRHASLSMPNAWRNYIR